MGARKRSLSVGRRRRRNRSRQPKWILGSKDLDTMAQRRCLMILSVLSGEKSVDEVSREAQITPAAYYQLEKKALTAMIAALVPGAGSDGSPAPALKQMEQRIVELERTRRRLERLLYLTRMTIRPGPMTQGHRGRPKTKPNTKQTPKSKPRQFSTATGLTPWKTSRKRMAKKATSNTTASSPGPTGEDAP
jgi:hypothetical protein